MVIRLLRVALLMALLGMLCGTALAEEEARLSPYERMSDNVVDDSDRPDPIRLLQEAHVRYDPRGLISSTQQGVEQNGNYAISTDAGRLEGSGARNLEGQRDTTRSVFIGLNESTQQQLILTGNLIVKHSSGFDPRSLERELPLEHLQTFSRINTSFYRVVNPSELSRIADTIRGRIGVIETTLETLKTGNRPR